MRRALPFVLIALAGCMGTGGDVGGDAGGSGGQDGSGGTTQTGSGGSQAGTGGSHASGSGGAVSSGSGGSLATGSGGMLGSGGRLGSGGMVATGGQVGSGGVVGSGGTVVIGTGGAAGRLGSGGMIAVGGRGGFGGGGTTGSGGRVIGTGGVGTGGMMAGSGGSSAPVCTSGKTWTSGNGQDMRPGLDCKGCHSFTIAGTVYPTAHEPNNCDGTAAGGIKVIVTGADGAMITLTPSATSGNFYSNTAVKTPFTAKVTNSAGAVRMMVASQSAGNCNSCHTQDGANAAPGRIMAP